MKTRVLSLAEALLVTFLWSTSYILIKIGLKEMNPVAFAAYRYVLASIVLMLPTCWFYRKRLKRPDLKQLLLFFWLGFTGYFIAQGLQFMGLYYLQPITVTFILNLTPISVLILGALVIKEKPTFLQVGGISITLLGVLVFFSESLFASEEVLGILVTFCSGIGWAAYMIFSRHQLRENKENVLVLTVSSMIFGSVMLFGTTVFTGNVIQVSFNGWMIILWLSIVNTALAFVLWNHALKTLRAYEQAILQNTMLIQITGLAYFFLNETVTIKKAVGIIMVFIGVLIVQMRKSGREKES